MKFTTAFAAVAALTTTTVHGHMKMGTPKPYGDSTLNNSPLAADGSDFPCKQRAGVYDPEGASNIMAIGEPQTLSFIGGATHGGGSCQVSLTSDLQPTKNSKWMVIKSIEGGCPSGAAGNLNNDPASTAASTFQYTIPEGVAPGEYTIAWTWFNKIGNREMYMNCGPATVTGAKKKRYNPNPVVRRQSTFPNMYIANLAGVTTCTTTEGSDYAFPQPGDDVTKAGSGTLTELDGACMGADSGSTPAQAPAAAPAASSAPAATSAGEPAASGAPAATVSPASFATAAPAPAAPASSAAPSAAPAAPAASAPAAGSSSGAQTAGAACSSEGAWACAADGASFQRCASGTWTVPMAMPAGLKASCSGTEFSMVPI